MKTFAFLQLLTNPQQPKGWYNLLRRSRPFKISSLGRIRSSQDKEIEGCLIEMQVAGNGLFLDKFSQAARLAKERGAQILGFEGEINGIEDKVYGLSRKLQLPMTNGSSFCAWLAFEAIYRLARAKNLSLKTATCVVIGAASPAGGLITRKLSGSCARLVLSGGAADNLRQLKEVVAHLNPAEIIIEADRQKALKEADIVVIAEITPGSILDINDFKPGAIICDASCSRLIAKQQSPHSDITVVDTGLVKLPFGLNCRLDFGLPAGVVRACLAETMLLTFEERFTCYSLGENINLDKLEEIADIACRHGFEAWLPEAPLV